MDIFQNWIIIILLDVDWLYQMILTLSFNNIIIIYQIK